MRIFRTEHFITEEERLEILQWFENSSKDGITHSPENRDKILWTLTGNGINSAGIADRMEE